MQMTKSLQLLFSFGGGKIHIFFFLSKNFFSFTHTLTIDLKSSGAISSYNNREEMERV